MAGVLLSFGQIGRRRTSVKTAAIEKQAALKIRGSYAKKCTAPRVNLARYIGLLKEECGVSKKKRPGQFVPGLVAI
jgi:hypothetical protein